MLLEFFKKIAPYIKYIIFGSLIVILFCLWRSKTNQLSQLDQEMQLFKRQMSGQLTDAEKKLETANNDLGVAQSKMLEQSALAAAYKKENIQVNSAFEAFKKQYNLQLEAYQRTIAQLEEQINSKNTTIVTTNNPRTDTDPKPDKQFDHAIDPNKEKLSYDWKSGDGRFELYDPDIFVASVTKTFTLKQNFRVTGEIYEEKVGFLKTQRLTLEEVVPDGKNKDGTVKYKTVGTAKVVDSHFNYTVAPPNSWIPKKGIFGIWPTISANLGLMDGLTPHFLIGTGIDWINYKGLGTGVNLYLDTTNYKQSAFGIDLTYRPTILGHELNLGFTAGIATEFARPFNTVDVILGTKFYLW